MLRANALSIIALFAYHCGLCALFYRLNRKAKRIITFHNVLPDELMHETPSVGCMDRASDFARAVDEMAKRYKFSTDVSDASTITITFDDGMLNQYEVAGGILQDRGIPAILFVAGDAIGATPENTLIVDQVLLWLRYAPDDAVERAFGKSVSRGELWGKIVQPAYRRDAETRGASFLARLNSIYPMPEILKKVPPEWARLRLSGVTQEHLGELRARGWKIGWHTKSHFPLGCLNDEQKRQELDSPPEYRDVVLSYPYGDIGAIGESSLKIAQELGYPCAVSNDPDFSPHRGRYFLQRMALSPNKYELHFVLSGLKYFLKCRKLLPRAVPILARG